MTSQCNFNLICISFNMRDIEHLFIHLGVICVSYSLHGLCPFSIGQLVFLLLIFINSLYIIDLTYEFQIGEFTPLLKVFCNPQINTQRAFVFIHRYAQRGKICHPMCTAEVKQGCALPSCFSSHTIKNVLFMVYLMPHFYIFVFFSC